jgi:thymidylate synthase ThyX
MKMYDKFMLEVQHMYHDLRRTWNIPEEDAREVLPLATTHRISWTLNLAAIRHIIGKRSCWILQLGHWGPVLEGMVDELATKVHPYLRTLINPPCVKGEDEYVGCPYKLDNEKRTCRQDPRPPCLLWQCQEREQAAFFNEEQAEMAASYSKLWGRNPRTGRIYQV